MTLKPEFKTMLAVASMVLLPLFGVSQAGAATGTATMTVTAVVPSTCTITTTNMSFGDYDGTVDVAATGTVNIDCVDPAASISLAVDSGNNGTVTDFGMDAAAADVLLYNLFEDAGLATPITPAGSVTLLAAPIFPLATTIYGKIPASQAVANGLYTDTLTFTVTW